MLVCPSASRVIVARSPSSSTRSTTHWRRSSKGSSAIETRAERSDAKGSGLACADSETAPTATPMRGNRLSRISPGIASVRW